MGTSNNWIIFLALSCTLVFSAKRHDPTGSSNLIANSDDSRLMVASELIEMEETNVVHYGHGKNKRKYKQKYGGVRVYDTIIVAEDEDDHRSITDGSCMLGLDHDLRHDNIMACSLDHNKAKEITAKHFSVDLAHVYKARFEHIIYVNPSDSIAYNSVLVDLPSFNPVAHTFQRLKAILDQCSGAVLHSFQSQARSAPDDNIRLIKRPRDQNGTRILRKMKPIKNVIDNGFDWCDIKETCGNPKLRIDIGSTDRYCLPPMQKDGDDCKMQDDNIRAMTLKGYGTSYWSGKIIEFPCLVGPNDGINGGYSPNMDVSFFGSKSIQMYMDEFDYDPITEHEKPIPMAKSHFYFNFQNAFWDGREAVFGDGDGVNSYPWTHLDTVAHELGHAIIEWNADLEYSDQSGGMNEAFADMVGEMTEEYLLENGTDWLGGAEIFYNREALRYFDDPTKDGWSIGHARDFQRGMSVHRTSGVYNKAYYYISNDPAFGIKDAFGIFLDALRSHWRETTDWNEGFCGVIKAANTKNYDLNVITDVFESVGVGKKKCRAGNIINKRDKKLKASRNGSPTKTGLTVNNKRNPIFHFKPKGNTASVSMKTNNPNVNVTFSYSFRREDQPLTSTYDTDGSTYNSVSTDVIAGRRKMYVWLHTDDETIVTTDITLEFSR